MNLPGGKKLRSRWCGPFEVREVDGDLKRATRLAYRMEDSPNDPHCSPETTHGRDDRRFPLDDEITSHDDQSAHQPDQPCHNDAHQHDLSDYNERGAVIAQLEREEQQSTKPRTRAAVQHALTTAARRSTTSRSTMHGTTGDNANNTSVHDSNNRYRPTNQSINQPIDKTSEQVRDGQSFS